MRHKRSMRETITHRTAGIKFSYSLSLFVLIPKIIQIIALIMIIFYTHTERRRATVIGVNRYPKWGNNSPHRISTLFNDCNFSGQKHQLSLHAELGK